MEVVLSALRGAGEGTRLRILHALGGGELAVTELTQVLGQSQPRISRHLKLLQEAGLIERRREGAWAFFRLQRAGFGAELARLVLTRLDARDTDLAGDTRRLAQVRSRREAAATAYFRENARMWDRLRALYAPEAAVEAAARDMLRPPHGGRFARLLDLGAGTGRMLELFADRYSRAIGYDINSQMLSFARARLQSPRFRHAELRQGDILGLPEPDGGADAAVSHMVLHFLADPPAAIGEAARCLSSEGLFLIVDFAPHELEFLREKHAHRRLGFATAEIAEGCAGAGLEIIQHRDIPPEAGARDKLTVSLWLARKA